MFAQVLGDARCCGPTKENKWWITRELGMLVPHSGAVDTSAGSRNNSGLSAL